MALDFDTPDVAPSTGNPVAHDLSYRSQSASGPESRPRIFSGCR
jgi:hypothetical protein